MTVGDLRAILATIPDETPVVFRDVEFEGYELATIIELRRIAPLEQDYSGQYLHGREPITALVVTNVTEDGYLAKASEERR